MITQEKKLSILIAESDPDLLSCLKQYLNENYNVVTFHERDDIIRHAPASEFILLDSRLVLFYGIEFLDRIKSASKSIHVVVMGDVKTDNKNYLAIIKKTVTKIIHKPFKPEEIDKIISDHT